MSDLPKAIALLIVEFMKISQENKVPKVALIQVRDALERLSTDPRERTHLRKRIALAKLDGKAHIENVPLFLLEALLPEHSRGGCQDD